MQKDFGFSLLELAIALLVVGLLVAGGIQLVTIRLAAQAPQDTLSRVYQLKAAMENYYFEKGYYPWPANPTRKEGDADYGKQDNTLPVTAAPTETVIGAVPFVDLKVPIKYTLDGWNNKFTYAVSRSQTSFSAPAAIPTTGVISATVPVAGAGGVYTPTEVSGIHWVIVSHGNLGLGAYTTSGVLIPCPTGAGATVESDNCDGDSHFYMSGESGGAGTVRSLKNDANYIDDYTLYSDKIFTRFWISPDTPGQTNAVNISGIIGINNDMPGMDEVVDAMGNPTGVWNTNGVDFDVGGVVRANPQGFGVAEEKGDIDATQFCAADGSDCFQPEKIGGVGMQDCVFAPGVGTDRWAGMQGIGMNAATCIKKINNLTLGGTPCGSGKFMTGLTAGGAPKCK